VWSAVALALSGGFGAGMLLGLALALGWPLGRWWLALAQAHGHVQLFGWAGLMVLGVGLHFLPRLRGAPLVRPGLTRPALALLVVGLSLRLVAQPLLAADARSAATPILGVLLTASGVLELAGVAIVVGLLLATARLTPPLDARGAIRPVMPFFALAFASLLVALSVNMVGLLLADGGLVPTWADRWTAVLGLEGFLVPVAVAMSMRTFPLYFRTRLPRLGLMRAGLLAWGAGLAVRLAGLGPGASLQAAGVVAVVVGLGVFARREPRPRDPTPLLMDPAQWHALGAYGWLALAALVLALGGREDVERHALGAGFVTLLIFGVGAHMLPGFARRSLRGRALVWTTLALGNAAVLVRVLPGLAPDRPDLTGPGYALAGAFGLAAVVAFAFNVLVASGPRRWRMGGKT
jgi:uncharacterized protein involved in response to NO